MTTRTLEEKISQAKVIIYLASAKFLEKQNIAAFRGSEAIHQGSYVFEDEGLNWFMTRFGYFPYGDTVRVNRAVQDLREAFNRSHPTRQTDKRIMISKITPIVQNDGVFGDNTYMFDIKWRVLDNDDAFFRQINFTKVNLDEFYVNPDEFPGSADISFTGFETPVEEVEPETEDEQTDGTYHLLNDIGLYKKTVRERFSKNWDINSPEHQPMRDLMEAYRQRYTLDELDLISAYLVPDKMRDILSEYYSREPAFFDGKINALDVRNAEAAEADYQKLRDFIDYKMLQAQQAVTPA